MDALLSALFIAGTLAGTFGIVFAVDAAARRIRGREGEDG